MATKIKWTKTALETLKFVVRLVLLIGIPQLVKYVGGLDGDWTVVLDIISILAPIIDKWIHEDPRIKATGIVPF